MLNKQSQVSVTQYLFPTEIKNAVLDSSALKHSPRGTFTARRNELDNLRARNQIATGTLTPQENNPIDPNTQQIDTLNVLDLLLQNIPSHQTEERGRLLALGKMALTYMCPSDFRRRFPDGRMWSNPGLSTKEHGQVLLETSVRSVRQSFQEFVKT